MRTILVRFIYFSYNMSRIEAIRGLFRDAPFHFELRSHEEDDTSLNTSLSLNVRATPVVGRLATMYDLTFNNPHKRKIFSGIGYRIWNPPAQKSKPYH
ncbi:hypothetical protein AVEN_141594-1 [Araneus ventricosus]|uniref:Uncharacterized protein n=1 Tax=Araneus ventricosus TaxID=182803 RepID=A0A4Y2U1V6_ARAVE|nr:hypothetical protein AVEN_141594-1 [Araneus ventricosus]